jgi:hypothetical protein
MKKNEYTAVPMKCQWFIRCMEPAITTIKHPILGNVPCCVRCIPFARRAGEQRHTA